MVKFILAAMLAVLAVTYTAAPVEACPGTGVQAVKRARLAVRKVVCVVREPLRPRAVYVVPAFVAPAPKAVPTPMPSAKSDMALEDRVARLEKNTQDAGRALLFGANQSAPALKAATTKTVTVTVTKSVSECPPGGCPTANVRLFPRLRLR